MEEDGFRPRNMTHDSGMLTKPTRYKESRVSRKFLTKSDPSIAPTEEKGENRSDKLNLPPTRRLKKSHSPLSLSLESIDEDMLDRFDIKVKDSLKSNQIQNHKECLNSKNDDLTRTEISFGVSSSEADKNHCSKSVKHDGSCLNETADSKNSILKGEQTNSTGVSNFQDKFSKRGTVCGVVDDEVLEMPFLDSTPQETLNSHLKNSTCVPSNGPVRGVVDDEVLEMPFMELSPQGTTNPGETDSSCTVQDCLKSIKNDELTLRRNNTYEGSDVEKSLDCHNNKENIIKGGINEGLGSVEIAGKLATLASERSKEKLISSIDNEPFDSTFRERTISMVGNSWPYRKHSDEKKKEDNTGTLSPTTLPSTTFLK